MNNEMLFYICGGVLAVSAVLVTFVGLKLQNFPGRALPLVIVWFAVFMGGATTFAVLHAQDEEEHEAHKLEMANERIEAAEGQPHENEAGPREEEPVGESEGSKEASGGDPTAGATVFAGNCAVCHGETGHGGAGGPDLRTMPLAQTEAGAVQQVTNGGGGMPPFGEQLSEEEIANVAAFVVHDVVGK